MEAKKDKNFLQKLKDKVSPQAAMGNILGSVMPQVAAQLVAMERPIEEGGVLHEGEDKVGYLVIHVNGEINVSLIPLSYNEAAGGMVVKRPIKTYSGQEAFLNISSE